jgi:hypothetical protein
VVETDTVRVPGVPPDPGLADSQAWFVVADQAIGLPVELVRARDWETGAAPPTCPPKLRLVGAATRLGFAAAVKVKVTGTVTGEFPAPAAVRVSDALCVPAVSPAVDTLTESEPAVDPPEGVTPIHG